VLIILDCCNTANFFKLLNCTHRGAGAEMDRLRGNDCDVPKFNLPQQARQFLLIPVMPGGPNAKQNRKSGIWFCGLPAREDSSDEQKGGRGAQRGG